MPKITTRIFGVGLAAGLAAVTLVLGFTGQLGLYINPQSSWFAMSMAALALVGTIVSCVLPLGAEADHGHDHGAGHDHGHDHEHSDAGKHSLGGSHVAGWVGGILAAGVVAAIVLVPPATLSAQIAMQRDTGAPPLFQGADSIALASSGDTAKFGVGDWASVFATSTNPESFEGEKVTLTGFATPASAGKGFQLTRLVITHCVIDAQPASVPIAGSDTPGTGTWVSVTGTIRDVDGALHIQPTSVTTIAQPKDPYEF